MAAAAAPCTLAAGGRVLVAEVRSRPELNGRHAVVRACDPVKGRCVVLVDGEPQPLSLPTSCLRLVKPDLVERSMRVAARAFLPGDHVVTAAGGEGTIRALSEREATVSTKEGANVTLLRDCTMVLPSGRCVGPVRTERRIQSGFAARCHVDAAGRWQVDGGGRGVGGKL